MNYKRKEKFWMDKGKPLQLEARNGTYCLDGIRVILALMVLISHFYNYIGGRYVWGIRIVGALGARAVDVFFYLSGFLTIYTYINKRNGVCGQRLYLLKRFFRIYPVYFIVIIIAFFTGPIRSLSQCNVLLRYTGDTIAAFGAVVSPLPLVDKADLIQHLLLVQGIISNKYGTSMLGSAWSMPIEWFYYLIMALTFLIIDKIGKSKVLFYAAYFLSLCMGIALFIQTGEDNMQTFIRNLPLFFIGMITAMFYHRCVSRNEFLISFSVGILYLLCLSWSQNFISAGIILVSVGLMFFSTRAFAGMVGKGYHILSSKVFHMGGKISYCVYLLHMLLLPIAFLTAAQIADVCGFSRVIEIIIAAVLFMGICIVSAILAYYLIEKPFVKIGDRIVQYCSRNT